MKKSIGFCGIILILVMLFVTVGGTGWGASSKQPIQIGFIPMTLDNEYFITMINAAKQQAKKQNVKLLVQAGQTHGSAEEQLQIVENMISNKVNAICIVPSSSQGLTAALKKAQDAGIPIINIDTKLDAELLKKSGINTVPFIGTNNYDGAKLAGAYALKILNGKGKVAILTGIAGQQNAADRRNGFYDVIKGKLEVVAEQTADWEVEKGYNASQNIIQAHPDIAMIFAGNDNMALGAHRAIKECGKNIKVIGFDAINEALNSVKRGEMLGTVAQYPADMGIEGVNTAIKLIQGKKIDAVIYTKTKLIIKQNVAEFQKYLLQFSK
jgi:ribose transport system substrate-binding protein